MKSFELSSKTYKNGRRRFKAVLYELQPPECVINETGTKFNGNGITFLEEYAKNNLDSIEDMSVRVEFIDEDRTMICAHGLTGSLYDDFPLFEDATVVGHFTKGYIDDIDFDGETKRCVCGDGFLDEMCYPQFVKALEEDLNNGVQVNGSIEIYKTENNDSIVYKYGYKDEGRIPTEYIHSGWDMVIRPSDKSSKLFELNNLSKSKTGGDKKMDKEMLDKISQMIKEAMSDFAKREQDLLDEISELKKDLNEKTTEVETKDTEIFDLNVTVEDLKKLKKKLEDDQEDYWKEREILEEEIVKFKIKEKLAELNKVKDEFTTEELNVAKKDIEKLEDNINACKKKEELNTVSSEINSIKAKICMNIVDNRKQFVKKHEQNSMNLDSLELDSDMLEGSMSGKLDPIDTDFSGIY